MEVRYITSAFRSMNSFSRTVPGLDTGLCSGPALVRYPREHHPSAVTFMAYLGGFIGGVLVGVPAGDDTGSEHLVVSRAKRYPGSVARASGMYWCALEPLPSRQLM